jgi:hypothetical protein
MSGGYFYRLPLDPVTSMLEDFRTYRCLDGDIEVWRLNFVVRCHAVYATKVQCSRCSRCRRATGGPDSEPTDAGGVPTYR